MVKIPKSPLAKLLAGSYVVVFIALLIGIEVSNDPIHSDAFLAGVTLALPWSYFVVDKLFNNIYHRSGMTTFFSLMLACALLNTIMVYCFGLVVTRFSSSITKRFAKSNT